MPPSDAVTVRSSDACTPLAAIAAVTPLGSSLSGHTLVQPLASVQVIFPPASEVRMYSVIPLPSTSTVPTPGTLAVAMVGADCVPEPLDAAAAEPVDELVELLPQAVTTAT